MKNGWQIAKIGDVCRLMTGGTPSREEPEYFGGNIKWLVSGDIHRGEIIDCEGRITEAGMQASNAKPLPINSVLIALNGQGKTRGTVALLRTPATCNQSLVSINPKDPNNLLPEFLYANLHGRYEEIRKMTGDSGKDRRGLNMGLIGSIEIPVAPVAEQRRIVHILDEAFAGIATAKANAEKNLQNARALFESYLRSVFTERGLGWEEKPLISLCSLFVDSAHRTPKYQIEGIPALRPRDVVNGKLTLTDVARVSKREYEIQSVRHRPSPGDIVYSRELSYGWAVMLPETPLICLSQGMCLFRPSPSLDSRFLLHILNGPIGREQALRAAVGAAHPHINLGDIKAYRIPFPALGEQKRITQQLDVLASETQRLESIYAQKLGALETLKKSLLHRAFSGNL